MLGTECYPAPYRFFQPIFKVLTMFQAHDPNTSAPKLLRLEFQVDEPKEMPLVWILAHTLLYMWGVRLSGKAVTLFLTRAQLESKINILKGSAQTNFVQ